MLVRIHPVRASFMAIMGISHFWQYCLATCFQKNLITLYPMTPFHINEFVMWNKLENSQFSIYKPAFRVLFMVVKKSGTKLNLQWWEDSLINCSEITTSYDSMQLLKFWFIEIISNDIQIQIISNDIQNWWWHNNPKCKKQSTKLCMQCNWNKFLKRYLV